MAKIHQPPGVFTEENSAFPNSVVPVATAVPAFIGYTEKAIRDEKSILLKPTRISSFREYLLFFGGRPQTKLTIGASIEAGAPYHLSISESYFTLYSHIKMFFSNGGADCYIVSVGAYTKEVEEVTNEEVGMAAVREEFIIGEEGESVEKVGPVKRKKIMANTVEIAELRKGIEPLTRMMEPTLLVIPELTAIKVGRNDDGSVVEDEVKALYALSVEMLAYCGDKMRNRFAILDVWMDREKYHDPFYNIGQDITSFRDSMPSSFLAWGAAYYPWLETSAMSFSEISVLNIANLGTTEEVLAFTEGTFNEQGALNDPAGFAAKFLAAEPNSLVSLLDKALNQEVAHGLTSGSKAHDIKETLKQIPTATADSAEKLTQSLLDVSPQFKALVKDVQKMLNLLPPSASMAGIYTRVDAEVGVFQPPANISMASVIKPAINISDSQQEDLNIPLDGKAVNAIRAFPGKGTLVWGARTLDGNSQDWRFISVRRTVIFIEQSIKNAIAVYVFEPNTAATWANIKAMLVNFLTNAWHSGALAGATAEDAFSVDVGLGTTMTPTDILDGFMRITVKVAVARPADFIVITFVQKMQQS